MAEAVIVGYSRSPFTIASKGKLVSIRPEDLLSEVIKDLVSKTKINPEIIIKLMAINGTDILFKILLKAFESDTFISIS